MIMSSSGAGLISARDLARGSLDRRESRMLDEDLRALERLALAGGAIDRLAWSSALSRLGRTDEALRTLLAAREDPAVRAAIVKFPAWTHDHGDAGHTRFLDVAPITRTPRTRWRVHPRKLRDDRLVDLYAANPIVVLVRALGSVIALDAETGRELWNAPAVEVRSVFLAETVVLLAGERDLRAHDCWSGALLFARSFRAPVLSAPGILLEGPAAGQSLQAWSHPDPSREPEAPLWRASASTEGRPAVTPTSVLVCSKKRLTVLDRDSGSLRWQVSLGVDEEFAPNVRADASGVVARRMWLDRSRAVPGHPYEEKSELLAYDQNGSILWKLSDQIGVTARSSSIVVVGARDGNGYALFDRATGSRIGAVRGELGPGNWVSVFCAIARDTFYIRTRLGVGAFDREGKPRWMVTAQDVGLLSVEGCIPAAGRLYVAELGGGVACLESS
jgi:outer membrane protein assembly factor BamB